MRYIVKDPAGVFLGGDRIPKGEAVPGGVSSSQLAAWKRFGQIEEEKAKPEPEKPPGGAKGPDTKPPEGGDKGGGEKSPAK